MIGYGMLYAIAVGVPILVAVVIGSTVLQRLGRAQRGIWLAALALAMTLPPILLATPLLEKAPQATAFAPVATTGLVGLPSVVAFPAPPAVAVPIAHSSLGADEILLGLWLLASLLLGIRWGVAHRRLTGLTASLRTDVVDGVPVSLTSDLGPAVAGVLRPRILVPSWLETMPSGQRSLVLFHEVEHIRAHDPVLFFLSRLARVIAPWNPVVWLLSFRLVRAIELDCDRRVLRRHPDVEAYGTTLLSVSSRAPHGLSPAAAFTQSDGPLRQRILAMTTPPRTVSLVSLFTALTLGVLLIVGVFEVPIPALQRSVDESTVGSGGAISGVVTDASSERPLQHVQVFVVGTGIGGLTDAEGRFTLSSVPTGTHQLAAVFIGHERAEYDVMVAADEAVVVDLQLSQVAIQVAGVVVSERSGLGASRVEPLIYVDGVRVADRSASDGSYLDDLEPTDVERIEVLKGPAAVGLYGEEAASGVIQVFLKPESEGAEEPLRESISGQPIFTPYSVPPAVLNLGEVQRALVEAYPPELRDDGIGGTVGVFFFIDETGAVQDFRINQSSQSQALDDAALAVAAVYRFSPALNRDDPVAVWVEFPITFLQVR